MSENTRLTPVWIVYVDGRRLDGDHEGALQSIVINDKLNGISTFTLLFDNADAKIRDLGVISLESEISIHLGYKDDIEEVFSGEITGFRLILPEQGIEKLEVTGCNILHRLNHAAHVRSFEEKAPSEIIKGIIDGYSLQAEIENFGVSQDFRFENAKTDLGYIYYITKAYGINFFAAGKKIYVKREITVRSDEVIFEWGKSLISFEAEQNVSRLLSECNYIGWDIHKNESYIGRAVLDDLPVKVGGDKNWKAISKGGNAMYIAAGSSCEKDAEGAKQLALGELQANSFLFSHAKGSAEGTYRLRPGMRVTIKMTGETFDGEYIADNVCHRFDIETGYKTEFELKRNMCP